MPGECLRFREQPFPRALGLFAFICVRTRNLALRKLSRPTRSHRSSQVAPHPPVIESQFIESLMTFASAPPVLGSGVREVFGMRRDKRLSVQLPEGALVLLSKVRRRRNSALRVGGSGSRKHIIEQMCVCALSTSLTGRPRGKCLN